MSPTLLVWLLLFAVTAFLSLQRTAWGIALYMLTFFLAPAFWWWGRPVADYRWNLYASLIILASVALKGEFNGPPHQSTFKRAFLCLALLIVVNASAVHFLLAPYIEISASAYELVVKQMLLFFLMVACIRDHTDLKIVALAIVLGATYIGYEVTINDRGSMEGNRLEGVGVPNASSANHLACLMVSTVPLVAPFFLFGNGWEKILAVVAGPLILNVLILCNSRGAFLALIILGLVYVAAAPKKIRPQILKITALGLLAGWLLLGDPRIVERFMSTFTDSEELDASATSRLDFWRAGMLLIADHPLGAGGYAFKTVYGPQYIGSVTGEETARSVHQGYLNEACEWGLQGLSLRLSLLLMGVYVAWKNARQAMNVQNWFIAGISISLVASIVGLLAQSFFGTFLDNEWGLWMIALAVGCGNVLAHENDEDSEHPKDKSPHEEPDDGSCPS